MADNPSPKKGKTSPKKSSEVGAGAGQKKAQSPTSPTKASPSKSAPKLSASGDKEPIVEHEPVFSVPEQLLEEKKIDKVEKVETDNPEEEEEGAAGGSWSGWFTSTINSAKEKSTEMLQYLKQDLSEFTETVSEAGRDLKDKLKIEESAKQAANVVGEKMNVVLEQMSSIFGVGPDDDDEAVVVGNTGRLVVDRVQAKIYSLAMDDTVFVTDPEDMEAYEKWLSHFDLEHKNDEIAELLHVNPHLQLHYSLLVPDKVSHLVFWHRFYFRVQLIIDEEAKHAKELQEKQQKSSNSPAEQTSGKNSPTADAAGGDASMVEISEEDQKRLLAEYEEELKKGDESGKHSRRSSGTQLSSSSSGSFAFVTRDPDTNELKVE